MRTKIKVLAPVLLALGVIGSLFGLGPTTSGAATAKADVCVNAPFVNVNVDNGCGWNGGWNGNAGWGGNCGWNNCGNNWNRDVDWRWASDGPGNLWNPRYEERNIWRDGGWQRVCIFIRDEFPGRPVSITPAPGGIVVRWA